MKIKYLILFLVIHLATACNDERKRIQNLTDKLSLATDELKTNPKYESGDEYLNQILDKYPKIINPLIEELELCSINKYYNKGIVFVFSCTIDPKNKTFFSTDQQYNLIKITNNKMKNELLQYEQFSDYSRKPKSLGNNWYYIEQHEYFD